MIMWLNDLICSITGYKVVRSRPVNYSIRLRATAGQDNRTYEVTALYNDGTKSFVGTVVCTPEGFLRVSTESACAASLEALVYLLRRIRSEWVLHHEYHFDLPVLAGSLK